MSINTPFSQRRIWPPWPAARAFLRHCIVMTAKAVVALVTRRAARQTLLSLSRLDDRLLADIGLDHAGLTALMRDLTKQA